MYIYIDASVKFYVCPQVLLHAFMCLHEICIFRYINMYILDAYIRIWFYKLAHEHNVYEYICK